MRRAGSPAGTRDDARKTMKNPITPQEYQKARAFWTRINTLRRTPGHCNRCGRPWTGKTKQCDHCRTYHKQYQIVRIENRKRMAATTFKQIGGEIIALQRRCGSLEIAVARLQLDGANAYKRGWKKGYDKGENLKLNHREAYKAGFRKGYRKGATLRNNNYDTVCGKYDSFKKNCSMGTEDLAQITHKYRTEI